MQIILQTFTENIDMFSQLSANWVKFMGKNLDKHIVIDYNIAGDMHTPLETLGGNDDHD